jgi:capsular polysaccharide export protein
MRGETAPPAWNTSLLPDPAGLRSVAVSPSLMTILPNLPVLLGLPSAEFARFDDQAADLYLVSGMEGPRIREKAAMLGRPCLHILPCLLPRLPAAQDAAPLLGLSFDDLGSRDALDTPSRFETEVLALAGRAFDRTAAMALIGEMARPPAFREFVPGGTRDAARVLVIDERRDMVPPTSHADFHAMLTAAREENPGAEILLLPCSGGADGGILAASDAGRDLCVVPGSVDLAELAGHIRKAYTIAEDAGWNFLLAGVPVRCFGMPFYAGWGLTTDSAAHPRRAAAGADLATLVEVAMIRLSRYRDPFSGAAIPALQALDIHHDMARMMRMNARIGGFYRFLAWKRQTIGRMFAPPATGKLFFTSLPQVVSTARERGKAVVAWSSELTTPALSEAAGKAGVPLLRMEDGFIRSVGLGASGYQPLSLVLDDRGIYYDCRTPSRLEAILADAVFDPRLIERAQALINALLAANITKYNLAEDRTPLDIPIGRRVLFVPGQVEDDASILFGAEGMTAAEQLRLVRENHPNAFIIYKPHPDVSAGLRKGLANAADALRFADLYVEDHAVLHLLDLADEVHTITSLTGFEALLRGKPVTCYGKPFYAGWGLTTDIAPVARRKRRLTLEELVAGALILYPHYLDPVSGLPSPPEIAIKRIVDYRAAPAAPDRGMQFRSRVLNLARRLRRAITRSNT